MRLPLGLQRWFKGYTKPVYYFIEMCLFLLLFSGLATVLTQYENIMNYEKPVSWNQILLTGAEEPTRFMYRVDLFHEGVLGYSLLAIMGFSAFMFAKDLFSYLHLCQSLAYTEALQITGEVKDFV